MTTQKWVLVSDEEVQTLVWTIEATQELLYDDLHEMADLDEDELEEWEVALLKSKREHLGVLEGLHRKFKDVQGC